MAIYSRTGDDGQTRDAQGRRLSKAHPAIAAVGALDELNAHIGLCLAACEAPKTKPREQTRAPDEVREALADVQGDLFTIGALLASGSSDFPGDLEASSGLARLAERVTRIEGRIDSIQGRLGKLKAFILPAGGELTCRLHLARTVCRRGERDIVVLAATGANVPGEVLRYVNRLSDLLFVLARLAGDEGGEVTWNSQSE